MLRRQFLQVTSQSTAALVLSFHLPPRASARFLHAESPSPSFAPNALLEIASSGDITIWCPRSEMGQGVRTALPMIVAEELGCDWRKVRVLQADLGAKYGEQLTGGSGSVRDRYPDLRKAGAAGREMLIAAAAGNWKVPADECRTQQSAVVHSPTQRTFTFADLIPAVSALPAPADPALKPVAEFTLIGKSTRRTDAPAKVNGSAKFGIDTRVPDMLIASIERCPVYGGTPGEFNAAEIRALPGVRAVVEIPSVHLTHQFG